MRSVIIINRVSSRLCLIYKKFRANLLVMMFHAELKIKQTHTHIRSTHKHTSFSPEWQKDVPARVYGCIYGGVIKRASNVYEKGCGSLWRIYCRNLMRNVRREIPEKLGKAIPNCVHQSNAMRRYLGGWKTFEPPGSGR